MKKSLTSIFILILILGAIAGILVAVNKGYFDDTLAKTFDTSRPSETIVETVSSETNTSEEELSNNQEHLIERLNITLQKREKTGDNFKFIYSYQIIGGTSSVLTYEVRGAINQGDVSITFQNNNSGKSIAIEIIHPFVGEGIVVFETSNGAKYDVSINLSELMMSDVIIDDEITQPYILF